MNFCLTLNKAEEFKFTEYAVCSVGKHPHVQIAVSANQHRGAFAYMRIYHLHLHGD